MHILYNGLFCKEFYSNIAGLKLKVSGRISKKRGASRARILNYSIGSLNFNSINSFIDYSHIERKDKNGSQSIKVYASHTICYLP
jgi:ribosomal protein S3